MQQILPIVVDALLPLLALVVTLVFASLRKQIGERLEAGKARDAALELVTAAETSVRHVEQTIKPALVEAAADGKLTPEDYAVLRARAIHELKDQLSLQSTKIIEANSARLETVLERAIEAQVSKLKETRPPTEILAELKDTTP